MNVLPEVSDKKAVYIDHFPTKWQAVLFRTWCMVPHDRIARVLMTDVETLKTEAARMGLDPELVPNPEWLTRGYITVIREMWHLLTYKEITLLLDITESHLAFLLKEDDFLWHKLGWFKPATESVHYFPLDENQLRKTGEIKTIVEKEFPEGIRENAFDFVRRFKRKLTDDERERAVRAIVPTDSLRTVYSYFALYGDPLADPQLDPFPDALLAEYALAGVKGVWLQGILYQLVEFPFAPEISKGWQTRIESLKNLVSRAKQFGIGVYLYFNEPRSMDEAFFKKYPHLRGTREGDFYAMCTSEKEVKDYLEDALFRLFSFVPDLAGFFTITMSENLTNCYSRKGDGNLCPKCAVRSPEEVIAEVNNLMARGAKRASPNAKAIAWNWAWGCQSDQNWACKVAPLLTEGQIIQCTSESQLPTNVGGISGEVHDYSISQPGPGPLARAVWKSALDAGLEACAKTQFNNSWEMSAVPYIPVFDKVAEHVNNLLDAGVRHFQMSWTLGGYPSPSLRLAGYLADRKGSVRDFLCGLLGEELGKIADEGQKKLSEAFSHFPFNIETLYTAPQNYGPMSLFYLKSTGYKASMVGYPYDDLDSWRSIYPREIFEKELSILVNTWRDGTQILKNGKGASGDFDDILLMAESCLCHFASAWHMTLFVMARDAGDRSKMLEIVSLERENVKKAIELRKCDSRIGYEASNHYYYTMNDLAEKLINLSLIETNLREESL